MENIVALMQCTSPYLKRTSIRQMSRIIKAILSMTGRVTMLGISRWAEAGGSYRTVQRFFTSAIGWEWVFWLFFRTHLWERQQTYLLVGDESVVNKAGRETYGLDRFFSSIYEKVVPGLSFIALALVSIQERKSYPVRVEQIVRQQASAAPNGLPEKRRKKRVGRPRGRKTDDKTQVVLSAELQQLQAMLTRQMTLMNQVLSIQHLILDGKYSYNAVVQMARQIGLHLVSKLHYNLALYLPYTGPAGQRGHPRKYGHRLYADQLPPHLLRQSTRNKHIQTDIYQTHARHKDFADLLNVVFICKRNLTTGTRAHVLLFSSDLTLSFAQIIEFYTLRFQIEFNFRDAKQYWGLDDFMNIEQVAVTNAANLSLFMVNIAHLLLRPFRRLLPSASVLDLKAYFRGSHYLYILLNSLPQQPDPISIPLLQQQLASLGSIHSLDLALLSP
jgi:putative transposase